MGTKIKITEGQLKMLVERKHHYKELEEDVEETNEDVVEVEETEEIEETQEVNESIEKIRTNFKRFM